MTRTRKRPDRMLIGVKVPRRLVQFIDAEATAHGVSRSDVVRRILLRAYRLLRGPMR